MNSKRGCGKSKGKNVARDSEYDVDQYNQGLQDLNLGSSQDGGWEEVTVKKNKNKAVYVSSSKQQGSWTPRPTSWGQADQQRTAGGGRGYRQVTPPNNVWANQTGCIPPPPQRPWNLNTRPENAWQLGINNIRPPNAPILEPTVVEEDVEDQSENEDLDDDDDDDDEDLHSDEYDSDQSPLSHEELKKNRWYATFFQKLEGLTVDQINEPTKEWHCPACQNGPGAIAWYIGLQSLVTHAKTKGSKRVKIHRDLARLLEDELRIRGATVNPSGESFAQWKGLNEVVKDKEIVWPPMVVIMNTLLEQNENGNWSGMGNRELLNYFKLYEAVKASHSYGPKGHRGMGLLIFEGSAVGYAEAERLSKHFEHEGTDKDAWDNLHRRVLFYPGGKRQLYGYMATKQDMDHFNQHSQGTSKMKFDMVSYQEKVVNQLKQMNENNQHLDYYKNQLKKEKRHSKALEDSNDSLSQRLRKSEEENRIMRDRTKRFADQNKEEADYQEQFFKDQMKAVFPEEGGFDKMQQEECIRYRDEKLEEEEREKLMILVEEELKGMKSRHQEEEIKQFNSKLTELMQKYAPKTSS